MALRLALDDGAQVADIQLKGKVDGGEKSGKENVPAGPTGHKGDCASALVTTGQRNAGG